MRHRQEQRKTKNSDGMSTLLTVVKYLFSTISFR
jgi:hypothetical protein